MASTLTYKADGKVPEPWGRPNDEPPLMVFTAPDRNTVDAFYRLFQPGLSEGPFVGAYGRVLGKTGGALISVNGHYLPNNTCYLSAPFLLEECRERAIESSEEAKRFEPLGGIPVLGADRVKHVWDESGGVAYLRNEVEIEEAKQLCLKIMLDGKVITEETAKSAGYNPLHPILMKKQPDGKSQPRQIGA